MSVWSDWKCGAISEEEYRAYMQREDARDRAYEYAVEQAGLYHDDDELPFEPTCESCIYCKLGTRQAWEIARYDGKDAEPDDPRKILVLRRAKNEDGYRKAYIHLCVKDIEHIKEVNNYDGCEEYDDGTQD